MDSAICTDFTEEGRSYYQRWEMSEHSDNGVAVQTIDVKYFSSEENCNNYDASSVRLQ